MGQIILHIDLEKRLKLYSAFQISLQEKGLKDLQKYKGLGNFCTFSQEEISEGGRQKQYASFSISAFLLADFHPQGWGLVEKGETTQVVLHTVWWDGWPWGRFYTGKRWTGLVSMDLTLFSVEATSIHLLAIFVFVDTYVFTGEKDSDW